MEDENVAYSRSLAYDSRFDYLPKEDRYFTRAPERRYKLAVIGTGINGRGHIKSAAIEGRSEVVGIYDPYEGSVAAAEEMCRGLGAPEPKRYGSLEEAIADENIDGYIICTPNYTHRAALDAVSKANRPIFLEKPMATTPEDAAKMVRVARDARVPVQVGLQYRFKAIYVEAIHELLERRAIGELKTISIREHRIPFLDKVEQWNKFSKYSGGTLVEKCCHYFDLFNLFSQSRPRQVFAVGSLAANYRGYEYRGEKPDILDNASVLVEYENGVRANFDLCMFVPLFFEELVACGDGGRLRVFEQEDYLTDDSLQTGLEIYRGEQFPTRKGEPRYQGMVRDTGHSGADFYAQRCFVDLIVDERKCVPSVEEGYWSVIVGAAAEESVRTGDPVNISEFISAHDAAIE